MKVRAWLSNWTRVGPIQRWGRTSHKIDTTRKEMKEDVAGDVHRKLYGMSDKINAPENQVALPFILKDKDAQLLNAHCYA